MEEQTNEEQLLDRIELVDDKLPERGSAVYQAIVTKCQAEIAASTRFVQSRRQQFRDRIALYCNQRKQRDKVGITTVYTMINTLLAVSYTDDLSIGFGGKGFAGTEIADNLELVAKNDHEEMSMNVIKYLTDWDRFFFGVGIRIISGWDTDRQTPFVFSKDPLSWLPDPQGSLVPGSFRWHGFEDEMSKADMTDEAGYFDVATLVPGDRKNDETRATRDAYREAQGLNFEDNVRFHDKHDDIYDVVNLFTHIAGKKYLVTLAEGNARIVRFERIRPVFAKERSNDTNVPFPVVLNYYSPERNNPFGTSVCDLVEDKQRAKSVLANLKIAKEKADLYPMYLYNRDKVLNRRDLDFAFNKFIGVRGEVSGVVEPLRKDTNRLQTVSNIEQSLDNESSLATGASAQQSGVLAQDARTLGEVQQIQANANLRFLLGHNVNSWGDKLFWFLWYRCYVEFFPQAEEKLVEVTGAFGMQSLTLYRKQFLHESAPKIVIKSKLASDGEREKQRVAFAATIPLILQDPTKPMVSRRFAERELMRLHGLPKEKINVLVPPTPDELAAHRENELLSRNEIAKIEASEDHLSHIVIHMSAADSTAKSQHILAHERAYILSGQAERDRALQYKAATDATQLAAQGAAQNGARDAQLNGGGARQPQQNTAQSAS